MLGPVLIAGLLLIDRVSFRPLVRLRRYVRRLVVPLFRNCSVLQMTLISVAAGIGEEALFRGLIQAGLAEWLGQSLVGLGAYGIAAVVGDEVITLSEVREAAAAALAVARGERSRPEWYDPRAEVLQKRGYAHEARYLDALRAAGREGVAVGEREFDFSVLTPVEAIDVGAGGAAQGPSQISAPIPGKVVWITPQGAAGNRKAGIGVQFSDQDGGNARNKIETYLAGALDADRPTHTI